MSWLRPLAVFGLAGVFALVAPGAALAQSTAPASGGNATPSAAPASDGSASTSSARNSFVVSGSAAQAYEDDVPLELGIPSVGPSGTFAGWSTVFSGNGTYSRTTTRLRLNAGAGTFVRHYNSLGELKVVSGTGDAGMSVSLTRRTTLSANQNVTYTPSDLYGLFPQQGQLNPDSVSPFLPIHVTDDRESLSSGTTVGVTHRISRRAQFSATGHLYRSHYMREIAANRDTNQRGVNGQFSLRLSRNSDFRTDYQYRTGTFGLQYSGLQATNADEHSLQAGVDYHRPLSATRQVAFGGSWGSTLVSQPASPAPELSQSHRGLSGTAYLNYQFTREWQLRGAYRRGVEYVTGLPEALLADSASVSISGLPARRWDVNAMVGYSTGASALARSNLQYDTYTGTIRVSHPWWRSLNVFGEYVYYYYDLRDVARFGTASASGASRNVVHVGVSFSTPVISR